MILEVIDELIEFVDVDDEISDRTKEHWAKMVNKHRGQGWWRWGEHCVGSSWWVGHRSPLNQASPSWFWNLDQTVRSNRKNLKPLIFAVLLASRIALWEKSRDLCKPRLDLTVLRSMIRPLLTVPYFPLNLNLKQNKTKNKNKKTSFKFCSLQSTSSFKFWLCSPPVMCVWQGESMREREWERES